MQPNEPKSPNKIPSKVDSNFSNFPRREKQFLQMKLRQYSKRISKSYPSRRRFRDDNSGEQKQLVVVYYKGQDDDLEFDADFSQTSCSDTGKSFFPNHMDLWLKILCSQEHLLSKLSWSLSSWSKNLCEEALFTKDVVPRKIMYEPTNRRDENSILVKAQLDT